LTTVLTLALDSASQAHFETLRQQHYPPALNRIPAHVSLFHQLPGTEEVAHALQDLTESATAFPIQVTGVRSLGRGVAFTLAAPELISLHSELARRFDTHLIPQDRQRFKPHIVVQNKVEPAKAKELLSHLQAGFAPLQAQATGLLWWEYLGGPWRLLEQFAFGRSGATTPESPA
jgi:2'-5' RNA ligase